MSQPDAGLSDGVLRRALAGDEDAIREMADYVGRGITARTITVDRDMDMTVEEMNRYPGYRRCGDFPGQERFTRIREALEPDKPESPSEGMGFEIVLGALKADSRRKFTRRQWRDGTWVSLAVPDRCESRMYLKLWFRDGTSVPWTPSQVDLVTDDWQEVRCR